MSQTQGIIASTIVAVPFIAIWLIGCAWWEEFTKHQTALGRLWSEARELRAQLSSQTVTFKELIEFNALLFELREAQQQPLMRLREEAVENCKRTIEALREKLMLAA
ncbi:MAG TPA: hypothetical protein VFZ58_02115 [Candidatus Saccharimonadales bacterium]